MVKQLFSGTIQRKIRESAKKEQKQYDNEEIILLGINRYPKMEEKMGDELQLYPFVKKKKRKTLIGPIVGRRLAESHEKERLEKE